ncbi:kynurenine--oxoglutarate transaminase 3 [Nasonia vitripennis]|uniref:Aminotransferase class I/classII large domain-containing protein n=1 Tax=Nasonia vitripennis TaxID=7425 RepID=A0A7M7PXW5_NASVI|nr:kynurenine--oxoglutarate transaminase 3 [Nasonia vitripennis]
MRLSMMIKVAFAALICLLVRPSVGTPLSERFSKRFARSLADEDPIVDLQVDKTDDFAPPHLVKALLQAIVSNDTSLNQYASGIGHPRLRKALAAFYSKVIDRELDWQKNVIVTVGATEAVYDSFHALTRSGDEWIVVEPFFSKYAPTIKLAGGIPRFTSMKLTKTSDEITGADWVLDKKEIRSLFNSKTRGIILNNPNNPTGKILTIEELLFVADLVKKHDAYVIADDAHEWVLFDPVKTPFIRMAQLPGMWERTITIGTASKSFTVSGWRVGWAYAPANLISRLLEIHTKAVQSVPTPQQEAVAFGFEEELRLYGKPEGYFVSKARAVREKHNFMYQAFVDAGMIPIRPDGGYCMLARWPSFDDHRELFDGQEKAVAFENFMSQRINILGSTMADFYSTEHRYMGEDYIRFCLEKRNETLVRTANNLKKLRTF